MATALIDVTIGNITNAEVDASVEKVAAALKAAGIFAANVELNSDSEYDDEDKKEGA